MRVKVKANFQNLVTDDCEHPTLTDNTEYFVIGIDYENYRIVNVNGEPILYPKPLFEVLDTAIPSGWACREFDDGEFFLDPIRVGRPGFYEEWHGCDVDSDTQSRARTLLIEELNRMAAEALSNDDRSLIEDALKRLLGK